MKRIIALVLALCLLPLMPGGAAAQDDSYRLKPGDVVRVEVLEDASLNRDALILPDGRITLPLAGSVVAGGRTLEQLQSDVIARLRPSFAAAPTVFVGLSQLAEPAPRRGTAVPAAIVVHVVGEAAKPGPLQLRPGTTLLQAFSAMGGFSRFAATKRVQLRRIGPDGQEQVYVFDYDAMERGAVRGGMTVLAEGDVIVVPQRRLFE